MKPRTINIILVISLALNLLVVGALLGFSLRERPGPRFPSHLGSELRNVDPEIRREIRQQFRAGRESGRELHQEMRASQRLLAEAVLNEPFDEQAVREAFSRSRDNRQAVEAHMHDQMIKVMTHLNQQQRRELLRRLLKHRDGRRPPPDEG
mgnify:CR=1 FL=1